MTQLADALQGWVGHVVPDKDIREHELVNDCSCPCNPKPKPIICLEAGRAGWVITHNPFDSKQTAGRRWLSCIPRGEWVDEDEPESET
jgi:hypothetical protein